MLQKRLIKLLLVGTIAANLSFAEDIEQRDKVEQAIEVLKEQVQQDKSAVPPDEWNEENADDSAYNEPTNNNNKNTYTQEPPSVKEAQTQTTGRTKKDYANMPIPTGAKLLTLRTEITIPVSKDKYTVVEFPFEIKAEFGEFEAKITQQEADEIASNKQRQPVSITQKENKLVINSSIQGKTEAIIWGGPYPIVLSINIANSKNSAGYYVIKEQDSFAKSGSNVKKLENNQHEKVISILTAAMYKDKKPKGYEKRDIKKTYKYRDLDIKLVLVYRLEGEHYVGERWEVINEHKTKSLNLYEEMFYVPDIYSVSFLANPIGPKKSTSMFIVKKREHKQSK